MSRYLAAVLRSLFTDDRLMPAFMDDILESDAAEIDRVREQVKQGPATDG